MDLILIQLQELQEFINDIRIRQEITTLVGTVEEIRGLDFLEHRTDLVLDLGGDRRGRISIQTRQNMCGVLVVPVPPQLLQDLADILFCQESDIVNAALTQLADNLVHHIFGDLRALLCLELVQNLVQVVLLLVGIIVALLRGIPEAREI